jgi:lipopolysaccharide export system permease protein
VLGGLIDFSEKLGDFMDAVSADAWGIFRHYYLNFLTFLGHLLSPICVFLAVILFTSRLTQNSEIVAILSSGVSFYRLMRPYLLTAGFLTLVSFYLGGWRVPDATLRFETYYYDEIRSRDYHDEQNIHRKVGPSHFVYMYNFNQYENEGRQFSLEEFRAGEMIKKTQAPKVRYIDSLGQWRIYNPVERHILPNGERLVQRPTYDTTLYLKPSDIYKPNNYSRSLQLPELQLRIQEELERGGSYVRPLRYELHERFAFPFAMLILTVIGFALSTRKRRGGIALQLGLGLILAFSYIIVLTLSKTVLGDSLPVWLAIWTPNLIYSGIAYWLIRWAPK